MAVDDVRRAQIRLVEATERLDMVPVAEKYLVLGDYLYSMRHLLSHVHEAGKAFRSLDSKAKKRVDEALAGNGKAVAALKALRVFFNAENYPKSFIAQVRNAIGSHYDNDDVEALIQTQVMDDSLLESTVTEVAGLVRIADPFVREIMFALNGGDFLTKAEHSIEPMQALDITGHLLTFVDHLFDALLQQHPDAIVETREALLDVPPLVIKAREAVEAAREKLRAEEAPGRGH
jgi:hypothetical protein